MAKLEKVLVPPVPAGQNIVLTLSEYEAGSLRYLLYAGIGQGTISKLGLVSLNNILSEASLGGRGNRPHFVATAQGA